jgi:hypothetical protein
MVIEIKQLIIKSTVVDEDEDTSTRESFQDRDYVNANIKHEVLSECRRLIVEMLSDKGSR